MVSKIDFSHPQDPPNSEERGALRGRLLPRRRLLALLQQADQGGAGAVHVEEAAPVGGAPGHLRRRHEQEGRHPGISGAFRFTFDTLRRRHIRNLL